MCKDIKKTYLSEKIIRTICVLGVIVLVASFINAFIVDEFNLRQLDPVDIIQISSNILAIVLFVLVFFIPGRVEFLAIISFVYTVGIIGFEEEYLNVMGLFMYYLTVIFLLVRGFYYDFKKLKITVSVIIIVGLLVSRLRFGVSVFINSVKEFAGYTLVLTCILYFFYEYLKNNTPLKDQKRILDLSEYDENQLSQMDKEWIELVLTNEKYETIARKYNYSLGHVKNRMHYIYATIKVLDRIDLFSKYAGCIVVKTKEELEALKINNSEN